MPKVINPFDIKTLKAAKGYDATFINKKDQIDIANILSAAQKKSLPKVDGDPDGVLKYSMLSVLYHKKRKIPFVSVYNIDGTSKIAVPRLSSFKADDRIIEKNVQLGYPFYDLVTDFTEFEIGHMASHNELSWGKDGKLQAFQTFHFVNSVPQVERLNSGLWSKLESYIIKESADTDNKRMCVFTGPMMKDSDPTYVHDKTFQVPLYFFKLVVFAHKGKLYSTAFVMSQYKRAVELKLIPAKTKPDFKARGIEKPEPFTDYNHKEVFQVNIELIEHYTGYNFGWPNVERVKVAGDEHKLEEIAKEASVERSRSITPAIASGEADPLNVEASQTNMILP
jgi:endonuclease G